MIRVLVVDDSATARQMLTQILGSDPEIRVIGEAHNGVEAVAATSRLRPDLVTMDLHMPRLDGLEATREIMITVPTPIVIVTGSHRASDVAASMEILACGALEVLLKPPDPISPEFPAAARRLIAVVKTMAHVKVVRRWRSPAAPAGGTTVATPLRPASPMMARGETRMQVVAIATSTGGPAALQKLLSGLPATYPLPILVVQHITAGFTTGLASWLDATTPLRVKVAQDHEPLAPHTVYFAPDDFHLGTTARGGVVALSTEPPIGGFRPSGTFLFESLAHAYGPRLLALILTGMGDDGVAGLRAVHKTGGQVIAQDEQSSIVFGMPGAAVAAGLAPLVLPIEAIAHRLMSLAGPG